MTVSDGPLQVDAPRGTREVAVRLLDIARRIPEHVAIDDLDSTRSYRELARDVTATAVRLDRTGRASGHGAVLLATEEPIPFVVGMLACAVAGRACVPIPARSGASGIATIAGTTRATALLHAGPVDPPSVEALTSERIVIGAATGRPHDLQEYLSERDAAGLPWSPIVAFDNTSGSTGVPKVVPQVGALARGRRLPSLDELMSARRLATNASSTSAFRSRAIRTLLSGSTLVPIVLGSRPPRELVRRLAAAEPDLVAVAPTLLRHLHRAASGQQALPTVEEVQCIGEALQWDDVRRARELCGDAVTVVNLYGSTEVGITTSHSIGPEEALGEGSVSVGRPLAGLRVWVAADDGTECTPGTPGTIVVDGDLANAGGPREQLPEGGSRIRTNDRGRIDGSGELWIEGRTDRTVKVAGTRVALEAVEEVLRGCPGVHDVAVVTVEPSFGEVRLVAHVVPDGPVSGAELRDHASERLTPITTPVRYVLHPDGLPLLASGKVDLRRLSDGD